MRSVIPLPSFLPSVHPRVAILSCFKANLCLSLQSSKVSGCFGSESHSHTLSRSEPTSPFREAWSYKATCGKGPRLGSKEVKLGRRRCFACYFFQDSPSARPYHELLEPIHLQLGARRPKKNWRSSHAVGVKHRVRCPFYSGRL